MVQSCFPHLVEIVLRDPRVPVVLQSRLCGILAHLFCEGPLILGGVALEDARCDPRLEYKPATCVDTTDLFSVVVERWCSLGELLCFSVRWSIAATRTRSRHAYNGEAFEPKVSNPMVKAVLQLPTILRFSITIQVIVDAMSSSVMDEIWDWIKVLLE